MAKELALQSNEFEKITVKQIAKIFEEIMHDYINKQETQHNIRLHRMQVAKMHIEHTIPHDSGSIKKRPRGRPPANKRWNPLKGVYETIMLENERSGRERVVT